EKATDLLDEDVWQAARPMDSASGLWIMADVDHALYTIIHAVQKHALESGLRWLYDLTCLTRNWDETTWIELVMQARRRGIMPAVQLTGTLWAWAQEKPWGELPFGDLTEPPPAAIEAAAKAMTLKKCSSRLPTVWREVPGGGIAGWLRYGWIVLTQEGKIGVKDVPQRMIYLIRQHGPALGQLLHGDAEARSKWRNQHLLYEWLREKNNEQV
ncbi:MAG: nucleotidyltransferase family protein, partial [Anaerolineae bacterium]